MLPPSMVGNGLWWFRAGRYKLPWDMTTRLHRQFNPLHVLPRVRLLVAQLQMSGALFQPPRFAHQMTPAAAFTCRGQLVFRLPRLRAASVIDQACPRLKLLIWPAPFEQCLIFRVPQDTHCACAHIYTCKRVRTLYADAQLGKYRRAHITHTRTVLQALPCQWAHKLMGAGRGGPGQAMWFLQEASDTLERRDRRGVTDVWLRSNLGYPDYSLITYHYQVPSPGQTQLLKGAPVVLPASSLPHRPNSVSHPEGCSGVCTRTVFMARSYLVRYAP